MVAARNCTPLRGEQQATQWETVAKMQQLHKKFENKEIFEKKVDINMIIKFSMDRIKNMDQIYTWTPIYEEEFVCDGTEEHYHGKDYCKQVVSDTLRTLNWGGSRISWYARSDCKGSFQHRYR